MVRIITVENMQVRDALTDISLTVAAGDVLALVGSQGSGKTTLLRVLAGQLARSGGTAQVGGVDCGTREVRRMVGVAGAGWGFYQRLTAWENLLVFARLWSLPRERIFDVVRSLDLVEVMHTRAERLRPGEVARLGLARALLHDPSALLLDDLIGDMDRESASVLAFVIGEAAERGLAVLITTFGHAGVLGLATRTVYMEGGRLLVPPAPAPPAPTSTVAAVAAPRHIAARLDERVLLFQPEEIRYAFAQDKAVLMETLRGTCVVSGSLTELEERLGEQGFFRCHRGFLVNLDWVKEIVAWTRDSYTLMLKDGTEVPLSKHRAQTLKERLNW